MCKFILVNVMLLSERGHIKMPNGFRCSRHIDREKAFSIELVCVCVCVQTRVPNCFTTQT